MSNNDHERYKLDPQDEDILNKVRKKKIIEKIGGVDHAKATNEDIIVQPFKIIDSSPSGYLVCKSNKGVAEGVDPSQPMTVFFIDKQFVES